MLDAVLVLLFLILVGVVTLAAVGMLLVLVWNIV